jgi:hypothetical protein
MHLTKRKPRPFAELCHGCEPSLQKVAIQRRASLPRSEFWGKLVALEPEKLKRAGHHIAREEHVSAAYGQFVELCRRLSLFTKAVIAIDGSKFKAVNNRDKNFTVPRLASGKRMELVDASIERYLAALDRADREESDVMEARTTRNKEKIPALRERDGTAGSGRA